MAIKTKDLKVGDILYDVHSERAGNTTMRVEGCWEAEVVEVAADGSWAMISWNTNQPRKHFGEVKFRRSPKEWLKGVDGRRCHFCHNFEREGHANWCDHPKAVAARKKAAKEGAK